MVAHKNVINILFKMSDHHKFITQCAPQKQNQYNFNIAYLPIVT